MTRTHLPLPGYVCHVEAVPDPWHADAFVGTPAEGAGRTGERRLIWYGLDAWHNLVLAIGPVTPGQRVELVDGEFWMVEDRRG